MAESTVKAVSPQVTLVMDLEEAKALRDALEELRTARGPVAERRPWPLASVSAAVRNGVDHGESIVKGVGMVIS